MTDNTFTVNNRECRVGADGKVLTKVTFGPESWGAEAWVPYNIKGQEAELGFMGDFPKIPFEQILLAKLYGREVDCYGNIPIAGCLPPFCLQTG